MNSQIIIVACGVLAGILVLTLNVIINQEKLSRTLKIIFGFSALFLFIIVAYVLSENLIYVDSLPEISNSTNDQTDLKEVDLLHKMDSLLIHFFSNDGPSSLPEVEYFRILPGGVLLGDSATMSWKVKNATKVYISPGIGEVTLNGSLVIAPTESTNYTLTAENAGKKNVASCDIILSNIIFDFIKNAHLAEWHAGFPKTDNIILLGGTETDSSGSAIIMNDVKLCDGSIVPKALWTHPAWTQSGWIEGNYKNLYEGLYLIDERDHLKGEIAFRENANRGNVLFKLNITPDGEQPVILKMPLDYSRCVEPFNYSLSQFAGKRVEISLSVEANGASYEDWAIWKSLILIRE
jgi:hypothetical protein